MDWRNHLFFILLAASLPFLPGCGGWQGDTEGPSAQNSPSAPSGGASVTAVSVTDAVPFSRETLEESRIREPGRNARAAARSVPFHETPEPEELTVPEGYFPPPLLREAPARTAGIESLAPATSSDFTGMADPGNVIPPDTMGAVGPSHLVTVLNSGVGVFNKSTGGKISEVTLTAFFGSLGTGAGQPAENPFDPKTFYDPHSGRFLIVAAGGQLSPNSWLLIAVSATSDPTGSWFRWAIDADRDGGTQQFQNWADFPNIGLDNQALYVTAQMYNNLDFYQYGKVWVIPKAQLLAGSGTISWNEFRDPIGSLNTVMQPAHTFGSAPAEYVVHQGSSGPPPAFRRTLRMAKITDPTGSPVWTDLGYVEVATYSTATPLVDAPQAGTVDRIETNDTRILSAVYRNGYVWATHHVGNSNNTRTEIAWYQIDPAAAAFPFPGGIPAQQGRISDPNRSYYYPSIAVNASGDAAIGFSGSSSTEFASAFYTARAATDPGGTMQSVGTLKAGLATYFKDFGSLKNRWGDYSATCVDPSDDLTFWTIQEYAASPANTWGTWWGSFRISVPPVTGVIFNPPPSPTSPQQPGTSVTFTAQASGGTGSYQYKFWLRNPSGAWTLEQDYPVGSASWVWNTTGAAVGTYTVQVWARSTGSVAAWEAVRNTSYTISPPPATGVIFNPPPSPTSPRQPGTSVTFTAQASGGTGSYQYKFWLRNPSGAWTLEQDYPVGSASWVWNTTGAAVGTYIVQVWARSTGSVAAWEAVNNTSYTISPPPATGVIFNPPPSPTSPQQPGTSVTFTAQASGGTGSYQYKFWLRNPSGAWTLEQDYPVGSASWVWNTTGAAVGTYTVQVWARSTGSVAAWEAVRNTSYTISPPPATGVIFNPPPSPTSPRQPGTSVTFTAQASGGTGSYQYKFWLRNPSGAWTLEQDYPVGSASWVWNTTGAALGTYRIQVWARSTGSVAAWEAVRSTDYAMIP